MTSMVFSRFPTCVVLLGLTASIALGQQPDSIATLNLALKRAQAANQIVRLHSVSGTESLGRIATVADSTVRIGRQTLRFADQRSLDARFSRPDPLWNGAAIGAVATVILVYPPTAEFFESMAEHRLTGRERVSIALGAALFGVLIGGSIDAAKERRPEWRLVWRRPEP